jgi:hypothetical protein
LKTPYVLFGVECDDGWAELYGPLMERCRAEGASIFQIKEKFGALCFYVDNGNDELHKAINEAEAKSLTICEQCGEPGKLRGGGWWKTLCDYHHELRSGYRPNGKDRK